MKAIVLALVFALGVVAYFLIFRRPTVGTSAETDEVETFKALDRRDFAILAAINEKFGDSPNIRQVGPITDDLVCTIVVAKRGDFPPQLKLKRQIERTFLLKKSAAVRFEFYDGVWTPNFKPG